MTGVADWQIAHFHLVKHDPRDWTNGALYSGMMEWAKVSSDKKYMEWLYRIGNKYAWQPFYRIYHADDLVVSHMYLEMYKLNKDAEVGNICNFTLYGRAKRILVNSSLPWVRFKLFDTQ